MARKNLVLSKTALYHVTNRSNNREWFYIPIEEAWEVFKSVLVRTIDLYGAEIRSFVLMSNHYHLILRTPRGNLGQIVRYLQTETARAIQRKSGRINHIFGTRYKWSILDNDSAVAYAYKYVARNPVAAGICSRSEDYRYSTIYELHHRTNDALPVVEGIWPRATLIPKNWSDRLEWLNRPSPRELDQLISKALRRYKFQFSRGKEIRRELLDLSEAYQVPLPEDASSLIRRRRKSPEK